MHKPRYFNPLVVCRCGTPASRVYQPATYVHKTGRQAGRVQVYQEAWCPACEKNFKISMKTYGIQPATLVLNAPGPESTVCVCGNPKTVKAKRCAPCGNKGRIVRPQDTSVAEYAERHRSAPGLPLSQVRKLLAKWLRQRRTCAYCAEPATTVDHVIPLSRGGDNYEGNLVPACRSCNSSKWAALVIEWRNDRRPKLTRTKRRAAQPKPPSPEKEPIVKPTCKTCGKTHRRVSEYCTKCDPEVARKRRIDSRNRYRAKVGLAPSDADFVQRNRVDKAVYLGSDEAGNTEPWGFPSLSPSREFPDPPQAPPASVWQCPGCGFVIGVDECCDCR